MHKYRSYIVRDMIWIKRILLYLFPALLILYGSGKVDGMLLKLFEIQTNPDYQFSATIVGMALSSVWLPAANEVNKKTIGEQKKTLSVLVGALRNNLEKALEKEFKTKALQMNIRIFAPKKGLVCYAKRIWGGRRVFYMLDSSALSSDRIEHLHFVVEPKEKAQGVTGQAYHTGKMCYDFQLDNKVSETKYGLNSMQLETTDNTRWVIAVPMYQKSDNGKITSIVTFDSKKSVNLPTSDAWKGEVRNACKIIHKCTQFLT